MRCFWCGEEIDDNSTKCKYCGIKIDKEAIEKRRAKREKDKKDFNMFGSFGLTGAFIPIVFSTDTFSRISYSVTPGFHNIILTILVLASFICSMIGTAIAIKNKADSTTIIMFTVGIILNALWCLLALNFFLKGATLASIVALILYTISIKNKE